MPARILLAGRDTALLQARESILQSHNMDVVAAGDSEEFTEALFNARFDAVVLCHSLRDSERERFAALTKMYSPGTSVVLLADRADQLFKFGDCTVPGAKPAELVKALKAKRTAA